MPEHHRRGTETHKTTQPTQPSRIALTPLANIWAEDTSSFSTKRKITAHWLGITTIAVFIATGLNQKCASMGLNILRHSGVSL